MKLTETQRTILTAAAERDSGAIEPLPARIKGGAKTKVIRALLSAGLITEPPFKITPAGRAAIGASAEASKPAIPDALEKLTVSQITTALSAITGETVRAKSFAYKSKALDRLAALMKERRLSVHDVLTAAGIEAVASNGTALSGLGLNTPAAKTIRKPRPETKQEKLIALLKRPQGATAEQIAEATGWQKHTIRAAISVALKKKLGLTVTAERVRMVGPNREGAPGSYTIYRIAAEPSA